MRRRQRRTARSARRVCQTRPPFPDSARRPDSKDWPIDPRSLWRASDYPGSGANVGGRAKQRPGSHRGSCSKNGFPNLGTGFVLNAKLPESELALSDPMHEFDAGDRRRGSSKVLEAEHRTEPQLDRSVILLDQIVDVLGRPDLALISLGMFAESLLGRAMRSLIAVER